jgi:hypothetical protein
MHEKRLAKYANHPAEERFDLNDLLHPAHAFGHPMEVVHDPDLTLNEKRAILASWASDACAVEAAPGLRRAAGAPPVQFDDVMDALRSLDQLANDPDGARYRRLLRRKRLSYRSPNNPQSQSSLN